MHPWSLTSGPACQPGPLARAQRGENSGEPELTIGDLFRRIKLPYAFYGSRRTPRTLLRGLKRTGASSPPAMAERRRCSPSSRGAGPVERDWSGSRASRCRGEHGALTKRHRKARRHADYVRGGGALRRRRNEGKRGSPCLTKRSETCSATVERGRSSGEDESENGARAGGERSRRSSGSNGDGGALRARSEGERAREGGLC